MSQRDRHESRVPAEGRREGAEGARIGEADVTHRQRLEVRVSLESLCEVSSARSRLVVARMDVDALYVAKNASKRFVTAA